MCRNLIPSYSSPLAWLRWDGGDGSNSPTDKTVPLLPVAQVDQTSAPLALTSKRRCRSDARPR